MQCPWSNIDSLSSSPTSACVCESGWLCMCLYVSESFQVLVPTWLQMWFNCFNIFLQRSSLLGSVLSIINYLVIASFIPHCVKHTEHFLKSCISFSVVIWWTVFSCRVCECVCPFQPCCVCPFQPCCVVCKSDLLFVLIVTVVIWLVHVVEWRYWLLILTQPRVVLLVLLYHLSSGRWSSYLLTR